MPTVAEEEITFEDEIVRSFGIELSVNPSMVPVIVGLLIDGLEITVFCICVMRLVEESALKISDRSANCF